MATTAKKVRLSKEEVVSDDVQSKVEPLEKSINKMLLSASQKKDVQSSKTDNESIRGKDFMMSPARPESGGKQPKGAVSKKQTQFYETANVFKAPCPSAIPSHF